MFRGRILENVGYEKKNNKRFSVDKMKEAIEVAQGKEFVEKMPL